MNCYATPILAMAALLAALAPQAQAQAIPQYQLTYNAADGSLTIDTFGNPLYNYVILATGELANNDGFFEANHILIPDAPGPNLRDFTSSDDELSQSDFNGWFSLEPHNLGNVLPAGLSQEQFNARIAPDNTEYVRQLGQGFNDPSEKYRFAITYNVPEPTSIVLFAVGAAMLAQRRRSHGR